MASSARPLSKADQLFVQLVYEDGKSIDEAAEAVGWGSALARRRHKRILCGLARLIDAGRFKTRNEMLHSAIEATECSFLTLSPGARWLMKKYYESGWTLTQIASAREIPVWVVEQCHAWALAQLRESTQAGELTPKVPRLLEDLADVGFTAELGISEPEVERWLDPRLAQVPGGRPIERAPIDRMQEEWRSTVPICKTAVIKRAGPAGEELGYDWEMSISTLADDGTYRRVHGGPSYATLDSEGNARNALHDAVDDYAALVMMRIDASWPPSEAGELMPAKLQGRVGLEILPQLVGGNLCPARVWIESGHGVIPVAEFTDPIIAEKLASALNAVLEETGPDSGPPGNSSLRAAMLGSPGDAARSPTLSESADETSGVEVASAGLEHDSPDLSGGKSEDMARGAQGPPSVGHRGTCRTKGPRGWSIARSIGIAVLVAAIGYYAVDYLFGPRIGNLAIPVLIVIGLFIAARRAS